MKLSKYPRSSAATAVALVLGGCSGFGDQVQGIRSDIENKGYVTLDENAYSRTIIQDDEAFLSHQYPFPLGQNLASPEKVNSVISYSSLIQNRAWLLYREEEMET